MTTTQQTAEQTRQQAAIDATIGREDAWMVVDDAAGHVWGCGADAATAMLAAEEWVDKDDEGNPVMAGLRAEPCSAAVAAYVAAHGGVDVPLYRVPLTKTYVLALEDEQQDEREAIAEQIYDAADEELMISAAGASLIAPHARPELHTTCRAEDLARALGCAAEFRAQIRQRS